MGPFLHFDHNKPYWVRYVPVINKKGDAVLVKEKPAGQDKLKGVTLKETTPRLGSGFIPNSSAKMRKKKRIFNNVRKLVAINRKNHEQKLEKLIDLAVTFDKFCQL
jgi:D-aminopeptidase